MNKFIKNTLIAVLVMFSQLSYGALVTVNFSGYLDYMSNSLTSIPGTTFSEGDALTGSFSYETNGTYLSTSYFSNWENNWFSTYFAMNATVSGANGTTSFAMEDANTTTLVQRYLASTQQTHLRFRPNQSSQDNSVDIGDWELDFNEQWFRTNPLDHTGANPTTIPHADLVSNLSTPLIIGLTDKDTGEWQGVYFRVTSYDSVSTASTSQAVPEPSPLALMSVILWVAVLVSRKPRFYPGFMMAQ